ncbi:hypothetical protein SDC9_186702 [bioreactor metagenome]|uniref:Uncharacterized protein n=1 Tax=bioreactor metagenome TaxID=1076179 RepID=A0A645HSP5_9ZZZZ
MIGITLAAFTFRGIYWRTPPYCLFPTIRLAYCTGIFLVPCTSIIAPAITTNRKIISSRKSTKPPGALINRATSATKACGKRAIIPIRMIKEIPLPTPLSVILSPNHNTNILPPARITVDGITQSNNPPGIADPKAP